MDPFGEEIYYSHGTSASGGFLDIDSNLGCSENMTETPVENIFWPTGEAPEGTYTIAVYYYAQCETPAQTDYEIRLLVDGEVLDFTGTIAEEGERQTVTTFTR
jgi:uncharacterized protein YfaP (DUF2135 family)